MTVHVRTVEARQHREGSRHGGDNFGNALGAQAGCNVRRLVAAHGRGDLAARTLLCVGHGLDLAAHRHAALHGSAMDQPARQRGSDERAYVAPAGGGAEQEDLVRVATESRHVALEPAQHGDLVEAAVIAGDLLGSLGVERRMRQEAEDAEPQVVADDHDALRNELFAVVGHAAEASRSLP